MSLVLTRLLLTDFRSYRSLEVFPDKLLTVVVGPNAAGKTNVIEALQLVTSANSFRNPSWPDLIRWGQQAAKVHIEAEGDDRFLEVDLRVTGSGRREYRVNGKARPRVSEVAGVIPSVLFTPDDLRLVKDSAERRRIAVDGVGDQLSVAYRAARMEYERVLKQRNRVLREDAIDEQMLSLWTQELIKKGASFSSHRRRLFERLDQRMTGIYGTLSPGERLDCEYRPSWMDALPTSRNTGAENWMEEALESKSSEERARHTTLVGPHRDDIWFAVDGKSARSFASQGQQRTIALAWKLAEVQVISDIANQPPVLLLDDVMSELDESRRHALAEFVGQAAQTFVTTTHLGYFDPELIEHALVVDVS